MSTAGCRPRTSSRSPASASTASSWASSIAFRAGRRHVVAEGRAGHAQVHGQRHQPLLGAVVQVALDAAALGVGRGDDVGPAAGQRLHPQLQLLGRGSGRAACGPPARRRWPPPLATHGAARNRAATSTSTARRAPGQPARVGGRDERRRPAGRHRDAAEQPDDQRQQEVAELAPGGRAAPGAGQPDRPPARRPGRSRDLDAEHGPEPDPVHGAERAQPPQQRHRGDHRDDHVERVEAGVWSGSVDQAQRGRRPRCPGAGRWRPRPPGRSARQSGAPAAGRPQLVHGRPADGGHSSRSHGHSKQRRPAAECGVPCRPGCGKPHPEPAGRPTDSPAGRWQRGRHRQARYGGPHDRGTRTDQEVRRQARCRRPDVHRPARHRDRLPRPQRRRASRPPCG